ncbi:uncharacterized protein EV422DRAFT_544566 [Fimicolochytrium jonesii]|uniref:uncharacterized protein n=1 Tax=Fimicolochytrium jonesii TaxID=1396493 RepID=UPI0022FE5D4C|nr:uncharacterized protein EV422DRAFT_544566 [Fimicolochytrium jonesii]KAI8816715.1 hypothetical protein EV422DRAFT_544566 [Fimicolochytrium jonesii]
MDKSTLKANRPSFPLGATTRIGLGKALLIGLGAGVVGGLAMTFNQKLEQTFITNRPNSYVPGYTLLRLLHRPVPASMSELVAWNHAMHWGEGLVAGAIRGLMAYNGIAGPFASFIFTGVRLLIDQSLENLTGVGAAPWTWPWQEQVLDIVHKAVYAFATGYVVDRFVVGYRYN